MKQAWFASVTSEERDLAMEILRKECPLLELHPVGHTGPDDAHVNPFFIIRYEGRLFLPPFVNTPDFPAILASVEGSLALVEGKDVPEWS